MLTRSKRVALWAAGLTLAGSALLAMCWRQLSPPSNQAEQPLSNPDGFDAMRAFTDLKRLVDFGPRPAGSENLELTRRWIVEQLRGEHLTVDVDSFVASTPIGLIPMSNIIAKIPGTSASIVIIAGHYDTKRMAIPALPSYSNSPGCCLSATTHFHTGSCSSMAKRR